MANKKILITGASGFVGQNVIDVIRATRPELAIYNLSAEKLQQPGIVDIPCDAQSFDFSQLPTDFDYVVNLLALSNDRYCADLAVAEAINVGFTKGLLNWSKTLPKLKKIVHLSSIIIYDNHNRPPVKEIDRLFLNYTNYSFTKGIADFYADFYRQKLDLPLITFRLSNIYGPHQQFQDSPFLVPSKIVEGLTEGKITVFNLQPKRDWIYAGDAAAAIVRSLDSDLIGIYNLASGKGISVEEIVAEIAEQLGVKYASLEKPTTGPTNFYCDISKLTNELGWRPTTALKEGLTTTIGDIRDRIR